MENTLNKVDKSSAIIEINKWLDAIDFEDDRIVDENLPTVEETETETEINNEEKQSKVGEKMLTKAVCDGYITFDENYQLKCQLKKPVESKEGDIVLSELIFKTRLATFEYNKAMKGIKADDADTRMLATISAFTNVARSRIDRLSTKEIRILQIIAGYLL